MAALPFLIVHGSEEGACASPHPTIRGALRRIRACGRASFCAPPHPSGAKRQPPISGLRAALRAVGHLRAKSRSLPPGCTAKQACGPSPKSPRGLSLGLAANSPCAPAGAIPHRGKACARQRPAAGNLVFSAFAKKQCNFTPVLFALRCKLGE